MQELGPEIRPESSGWLKVKAGKYTNRGISKGGGVTNGFSWWLVLRSKQLSTQGGHGAVIDALLPHCGTQGMTKAKLVELRNDMLAQHRS